MNDNKKVIDLKSRKPLAEKMDEVSTAEELNRQTQLYAIDSLRGLVEKGEIEGLILIGRHPRTGIFYYDCAFPMREDSEGCTPQEAIAYAGFLETVKMQFADLASWAPCVLPDGSIFQPEPEEMDG